MNQPLKIQLIPAPPEDLDDIYTFCQSVAVRTPSSGWNEHYPSREILKHDLSSRNLYKVLHEGKLLALMQIRCWADFLAGEESPDTTDWSASIHNPCALGRFCVSPDFQGQGLGRRIMEASLAFAREMGYDGARFHAVKSNEIANHLYRSMGFHCAGEKNEYGLTFLCYEMQL